MGVGGAGGGGEVGADVERSGGGDVLKGADSWYRSIARHNGRNREMPNVHRQQRKYFDFTRLSISTTLALLPGIYSDVTQANKRSVRVLPSPPSVGAAAGTAAAAAAAEL